MSYQIAQEIYCFESRCGRIYRNPKANIAIELKKHLNARSTV